MKKLLFILLLSMTSVAITTSTYASSINCSAEQVCVEVMGVSGNIRQIDKDEARAEFRNTNNYQVTVTWSVFAYDSCDRQKEIASGTSVISPNSGGEGYRFSTTGYSSPSLKMKVYKCS